jgi:molybdenum cofactor biosynthesis enzyme MoaA
MFDRCANRIEDLRLELNDLRQIICLFCFTLINKKLKHKQPELFPYKTGPLGKIYLDTTNNPTVSDMCV